MSIHQRDIGIMGTGTKMFRCGLEHSSGCVYLGTYGSAPAIVWKYDPATPQLRKVAEPGEYQLDSMVEAPDGRVYIGTAYEGLIYQLDPKTEKIKSLGSPAVASTPWIFALLRTRADEIYGAKGVGLFRLDLKNEKLESIGLVPGDHATEQPASDPIVRSLEEGPDGRIWGDTNRRLFCFDPSSGSITSLADMLEAESATYAVTHSGGFRPTPDPVVGPRARWSGRKPGHAFYRYDIGANRLVPLSFSGLNGTPDYLLQWFVRDGRPLLWVSTWREERQKLGLFVVDPRQAKAIEEWEVDCSDTNLFALQGSGGYFFTVGRGALLQADPQTRHLKVLVENPVPVECRSLAISPGGRLGTYTYDCGFAFSFDTVSGNKAVHGRVWLPDHRCAHGPAAFAGPDGAEFIANFSQAVPGLFVTDFRNNLHRRVGEPALQLARFRDGTVWGTQGASECKVDFDPAQCWTAAWAAKGGILFRYRAGAAAVETLPSLGPVGSVTEAPGNAGHVLAVQEKTVLVVDAASLNVIHRLSLPFPARAAVSSPDGNAAYFALEDDSLWLCRAEASTWILTEAVKQWGAVERGLIVLPRSLNVLGFSQEGVVTVYADGSTRRMKGPPPLPAGLAVDPHEDAWYWADRQVVRCELAP